MRFLLLLLPVFGFAQTGFRAEFNYLVSGTPSQGGDYRLTGLYADGDALGFPVDSVVAGSYFYDSKGLPYEIVYSSRSQPLTIEVDRVGHLMAPTIGLGLLTDRTSRKLLPYETSKIAGKLRSIIEVETRKLTDVDANKLAELLDVDTSGLADAYMIRYNADSAKWYVYPNNIDGLTDGYNSGNNLVLGSPDRTFKPTPVDFGTIYIGRNAGSDSTLGYANIAIGANALRNFSANPLSEGNGAVAIGEQAMRLTKTGFSNTAIGREALEKNINGDNNTAIGKEAGFVVSGTDSENNTVFNSGVFIGSAAWAKDTISTNEIVIGAFATGNGSNTATLGNDNITGTYLKGNINLRGYGAGNKEAGDLSKTATNYVLRPASDGTILEQENNIDGLSDATYDLGNQSNLFLGSTKTLPIIPGPANNGNIGIGFAAFDSLKYGQENLGIAIGVAVNADSLFRSIGIGKNSMGGYTHTQGIYHTKATESVYLGLFAGGMDSLSFQSTQIGTYTNEGIGTKKRINRNGVLIGYAAKSLQDSSVYETAIGANVTGNGDSTATIGQTFLKGTYLNGNINLRGYGLGNKEASDISKTRSKYIAAFATDGTLLELDTTGLFGAASGASSFSDLNDIDTTGLQDNYAFRYNSSTGLFEAKANNIDGLDDGYTQGTNNLFVGREPFSGYTGNNNVIITQNGVDSLRSPDGYSVGMVVIGANANDKAKAGSANSVIIGNNALQNSIGSEEVIAIGGGAGQNFSSSASVFIGSKAAINLTGSPETTRSNTLIGHEAGGSMTSGIENVGLGYLVNMVNGNNQIVIGSGNIAPGQYIRNTSKGPNSAKLGNERIDSTFLYGNITFPEYGLGNKEAGDISKTASQYFARYATDGTLIESTIPTPPTALSDLTDVDTSGLANEYILKYNSSTQEWEVKVNNIDGLSDAAFSIGEGNLMIGQSKQIPTLPGPDNNSFLGIGWGLFDSLKYGYEVIVFGPAAATQSDTLIRSIAIGKNSLTGALNRTIDNFQTAQAIYSVANGVFSSGLDTFVLNTVSIGSESNVIFQPRTLKRTENGVFIGARVRPKNPLSLYEIAIGSAVTGNGDSTATIGQTFLKGTYLNGTMNFNGYGLGNKEASDLSKTGSGYFLEVATDGTLVESTVTGGLQLSDLSVTVNSPGSANLQYDTITGVFSYTPPDLSSYLTSDTNLGNSDLAMGGSGGTRRADFTNNTLEIVNETGNIDLGYLDVNTLGGSFIRLNNSSDNTLIYGNRIFSVGEVVFSEYGSGIYQGPDNGYLLAVDSNGYVQEVPIGTFLTTEVDGSTTNEIQSLSFNEATRELTLSSDGTIDLTEGIQDEIAATLVQGEGITITYNDVAGTITVAAPSGAGNTDEQTLSINSATAELSISNGNTVDLSEAIDNQVNTLFVDGTNILSTYDDGANTLTVRTTDALTQIDAITFDNNTTDAVTGRLQYNQEIGVLVMGLQNNTPLQLGTDMGWYVKNQSGASIAKGTPVYVSGTDGASGRKLISPMIANGTINAKLFLGITAETIANGADGLVLDHGGIKGVNLSAFSANDVLYISPTVAGTLTATPPTAPNLKLPIGYVVNNSSNGSLSIRSTVGTYLSENHDVQIAGASNGQVLKYDGAKWVNGTDLVNDADADPNNEIQDLSLSGNTLSLSGDGTTVNLSSYLDDQTVSLTGAGITSISGTYPNFTITSTEVDGSTTNEIQDLSLSGNTLSLSGDATTVDLSGYVNNITSVGEGLTLSSGSLSLGGSYTTNKSISSSTGNMVITGKEVLLGANNTDKRLYITDAGLAELRGSNMNLYSTSTIRIGSSSTNSLQWTSDGTLQFESYGAGTKEATDFDPDKTASAYLAGFATDGTLIDVPNNFLTSEVDGSVSNEGLLSASTLISGSVAALTSNTNGGSIVEFRSGTGMSVSTSGGNAITYTNTSPEATTASNGLTETGSNIELGGTLTKATQINLPANGSLIMGDLTNAPATALAVLDANNTVVTYGTAVLADYGSNNKEASDLSVTPSNYKAAFATDGTLIEVSNIDAMVIACSDETTDIATGTAKVTFRAPFAMTITGVRASLSTASSSGTPTVDINEGGVSILGTTLSIDANERTSTTAALAATITDTAIADDAEITIDIDAAGTGAKGLKVTILYRK